MTPGDEHGQGPPEVSSTPCGPVPADNPAHLRPDPVPACRDLGLVERLDLHPGLPLGGNFGGPVRRAGQSRDPGRQESGSPGDEGWDRVLLGFLIPAMLSIFPVAALDDGRFHRSPVPWWVRVLGYVLLVAGIGGTAWAQAVNRFFEPGVRIQANRGHTVIDTGPYAVVRHPGYVAACLLFVGIALSLGSL